MCLAMTSKEFDEIYCGVLDAMDNDHRFSVVMLAPSEQSNGLRVVCSRLPKGSMSVAYSSSLSLRSLLHVGLATKADALYESIAGQTAYLKELDEDDDD